MPDNPWEWRDDANPYRFTPYQVLDLDPDTAGRAAVATHVRRRRQRITRASGRFSTSGRTLDVADVNEAAEQLDDPRSRLMALLRVHPSVDTSSSTRFHTDFSSLEPPQAPARGSDVPLLGPDTVPGSLPAPARRDFDPVWPYD